MKILLADKQDITRAGLSYVISKMEGMETRTIEEVLRPCAHLFVQQEEEQSVRVPYA